MTHEADKADVERVVERLNLRLDRLEQVLRGKTTVPLLDGVVAKFDAGANQWQLIRADHVGNFKTLSEAVEAIKEH